MTKTRQVVKEIAKGDHLKAMLYNSGVIEIVWNTNIETIEVIHLAAMQNAVCELGGGKKTPLFFTIHDFLQISADARKYATSAEGVKYSLVIAVLVDSLAKKLLFNFFETINKPIVPTKGFTNKEDAFVWLEKMGKGL